VRRVLERVQHPDELGVGNVQRFESLLVADKEDGLDSEDEDDEEEEEEGGD
jgi:hypothetical protein